MHTSHRFLALLAFSVMISSLGTHGLASVVHKEQVAFSLHEALDKAVTSYRHSANLQSKQSKTEETLSVQQKKMLIIERQQRQLRSDILSLRSTLELLQKRTHVTMTSSSGVLAIMTREKAAFALMARSAYLQTLSTVQTRQDPRRQLVHLTLSDVPPTHESAPSQTILTDAHTQYLQDLAFGLQTVQKIDALLKTRDELLLSRLSSAQVIQSAQASAALTSAQMEHIKSIVESVHADVLAIQGQLARIDARLKAKAQRTLIEKGLLDPLQPGQSLNTTSARPAFSWPAYGPVSAGFHDSAYHAFFGVAHEGMDIVVGQGSHVYSSADGVVFLVRDGGETGYTYILIGHRNGYATLYGHLSATLVTAGQEVTAGQLIGLSGGRPGTHGAGPMTTAPHLHFEVIQAGVNVDPKTVLPK